jgi:uncharacterized protein (DUF305 family)
MKPKNIIHFVFPGIVARIILQLILNVGMLGLAVQAGTHEQGNPAATYASWSELISSMEKMHMAMAEVKQSGDNDVDFVRLMLPHHQAAIDMAKTELLYGKDPQMRRLAQEIVTDQQSEIALMQLWLKQHHAN